MFSMQQHQLINTIFRGLLSNIFLPSRRTDSSRLCRSCSSLTVLSLDDHKERLWNTGIPASPSEGLLLGYVLPRHKLTSLYWRESRPLQYHLIPTLCDDIRKKHQKSVFHFTDWEKSGSRIKLVLFYFIFLEILFVFSVNSTF